MKRFLFWIMLSLPLGALAQSQLTSSTQSEVFWRPGVQLSDETQAILTQFTVGPAGLGGGSEVTVTQQGSGNNASLNDYGRGNRVRLTQNGDANQLTVDVIGNQNTFGFAQYGSGNVMDLRNIRANGEQLEISQQGNGNRLTSDGYPFATGVPIRIEQTGGMQLQITNIR